MPFQLLKALDKKGYYINVDFLRKNFGVSHDAAQRRVRCFQKNKSFFFSLAEREYDTKIVQKYKKFLGFSEPNISYIDLFFICSHLIYIWKKAHNQNSCMPYIQCDNTLCSKIILSHCV